jgi:hypothetical protein
MDRQDQTPDFVLYNDDDPIDLANSAYAQQYLGLPSTQNPQAMQYRRQNIGHPMFTSPFRPGLWPNVPPARLPVKQFSKYYSKTTVSGS